MFSFLGIVVHTVIIIKNKWVFCMLWHSERWLSSVRFNENEFVARKHRMNCYSFLSLVPTVSSWVCFPLSWTYFFYRRTAACAAGTTSWESETLTCSAWAANRWPRSWGSAATGWSWWSPGVLWMRVPPSLLSCLWCSPLSMNNRWRGAVSHQVKIGQKCDTNSYIRKYTKFKFLSWFGV